MTTFRLARTELRRLTSGRLPRLALAAIVLIPLLYGGMYLYANWDPYSQFNHVPVAVAVDDTGTPTSEGTLHAGQKVADRLVRGHAFDWDQTSETQAREGVTSGRYVFALVIPRDFSQALASPGKFEPRKAQLQLITNDTNNFVAGTIADKVASEVRRAVAADAGTEAVNRLLLGLSTVHDKTAEAADGAGQLADGAGRLKDGLGTADHGAGQLADGSHQLRTGQQALTDGAGKLADGSGQLASGAGRLRDGLGQLREKTAPLPDATARLADGAEKVADGNEKLADKTDVVGGASRQLASTVDNAKSRIAAQMRLAGLPEAEISRVLAELDKANQPISEASGKLQLDVLQMRALASGSRQVATGARQLANAAPPMTSAITQLSHGSQTLADGATRLDDGAQRLHDGERKALEGTGKLADGADRLSGGTRQLSDGSGKLADGSNRLADGLHRGIAQIPNPDGPTRDKTAHTIGDPVAVDSQAQVKAASYGAGLAPFFLSLALWVGAFVMFLLIRPLSNRALANNVAPWRVAVGGWLPSALVGAAQAVLLFLVADFGIGLHPAHPLATVGLLLLASFAFTSIVHALNAAFGARGRFIALIILVLQLATAGGTFPWQTIPTPLHPLHKALPMSYAVDGLRHVLYGGPASSAVSTAVAVLLGYVVAGLLLSTIAAWRQRMWTPVRLKPELSM